MGVIDKYELTWLPGTCRMYKYDVVFSSETGYEQALTIGGIWFDPLGFDLHVQKVTNHAIASQLCQPMACELVSGGREM